MSVISFPTSPTLYQTFTVGTKKWIWNGYAWDIQATSSYTASDTAPNSPKTGDQWYYITDDILYEYVTDGTTTFWLDVSSPIVTSSPASATSTDSLSPFLLMGA